MRLVADAVSVYFPHPAGRKAALPEAEPGSLGGAHVLYRGERCIRALEDVSFSLGRGDRLGVVGHNGSGKSTLLRTLAGIYSPQKGRVIAEGEVSGIFNLSIGFRPEATGYRNIVLKGLMAGKSRREIESATQGIADFTGLGDYLHMPLQTYSQGMALRLAFAISTTFSHDILVMDEWIGAGDAAFQQKVVERMNGVIETAGISVIASHNNNLLRKVTSRCLWLEHGGVRMLGPSEEVLEAYEHEHRKHMKSEMHARSAFRMEIPADHRALWLDHAAPEGHPPTAVHWDVRDFNVGHVAITVANGPTEAEQLICTGGQEGTKPLGRWVRPGMVFRLRAQSDEEELARVQFDVPSLRPTQS